MITSNKKDNVKRLLGIAVTIVMFVLYYLSTDPDTKILQNLPFGSTLILTLQVFFMAMVGILIIEFFPDFFVDLIYGNEKETRLKACETAQGAGMVMISKSLRMLAFAIIMAASIQTLNPS